MIIMASLVDSFISVVIVLSSLYIGYRLGSCSTGKCGRFVERTVKALCDAKDAAVKSWNEDKKRD